MYVALELTLVDDQKGPACFHYFRNELGNLSERLQIEVKDPFVEIRNSLSYIMIECRHADVRNESLTETWSSGCATAASLLG